MSADRDRTLEHALKHELRGASTPTPQCLDAETLAAWQDDGLDAAQMSAVELHLSACRHCQAMLSAFARGTTGTLAPETNAGIAAAATTASWWRWWFAPIAAGATAAVLWMVMPEEQRMASTPPQQPSVAAEQARPPAAAEQQKSDPPAEREARARATDSNATQDKRQVDVRRDDRQAMKDQVQAAPKEEAPAALVQPAAPAAPPAAARAETAGARVAELQKSAQMAFAPVELTTVDANIRWRFAGGRVERTPDGGATWRLVRDGGTDESVTAGSAPTTSVAWFAGRNGLVLLTVDQGATFTTVSLTEPLDISGITATDARRAVVSTVSGRRFRTDDAGRTWLPF